MKNESKQTTYNLKELTTRYEGHTASVIAECALTTELIGGMPAERPGVEAFVRFHLKLEGQQAEDAINRILREEVGEKDVPSETGELQEKLSYGINVIRRDSEGPWLGNWMIKACLKSAASRLAIFTSKRGSKGDLAEMGRLQAVGGSLRQPKAPGQIYLLAPDVDGPTQTYFTQLKGRIQSPQGSKSIVTDCECAPVGTRFSFEYRYYPARVKEKEIVDIFAAAMVIGLGSAKAFERGKFAVNTLVFEDSEIAHDEKAERAAAKKAAKAETQSAEAAEA